MKNNLVSQEEALKGIATKLAKLQTEMYTIMFYGSQEENEADKAGCISVEISAIVSTLSALGIESNYIFDSENKTIQFKVGDCFGEKIEQVRM